MSLYKSLSRALTHQTTSLSFSPYLSDSFTFLFSSSFAQPRIETPPVSAGAIEVVPFEILHPPGIFELLCFALLLQAFSGEGDLPRLHLLFFPVFVQFFVFRWLLVSSSSMYVFPVALPFLIFRVLEAFVELVVLLSRLCCISRLRMIVLCLFGVLFFFLHFLLCHLLKCFILFYSLL